MACAGGNAIARGDTDGVGRPQVEIILIGIIGLDVDDFVR